MCLAHTIRFLVWVWVSAARSLPTSEGIIPSKLIGLHRRPPHRIPLCFTCLLILLHVDVPYLLISLTSTRIPNTPGRSKCAARGRPRKGCVQPGEREPGSDQQGGRTRGDGQAAEDSCRHWFRRGSEYVVPAI